MVFYLFYSINALIFALFVMLGVSQADKHSAQHRKYVSLNEGYQEFKAVHEDHHYETYESKRCADDSTQLASYKDDTRK